jgi:hypothetical protein
MRHRPAGTVVLALCAILTVGGLVAPGAAYARSTGYEAEQASLSHGRVESKHPGFSGTGYVNYDAVAGSSVEWTARTLYTTPVTFTIRYANGSRTSRPMDISVNGTVIRAGLAFPPTGSWSTWRSVTIPGRLIAGNNLIRATATAASGGPDVDYLEVDVPMGNEEQAETSIVSQGTAEAVHGGYTGTGYVRYASVQGAYVEFSFVLYTVPGGPLQIPVAIELRYANGSTGDRPVTVTLNGGTIGTLALPPTGSWWNWRTTPKLPAVLFVGDNRLRVTATTPAGGLELDRANFAEP